MAEEAQYQHDHKSDECENTNKVNNGIESEDRGLFGLLGKKEEKKPENEVISQTEPKVEEETKHETLHEKFQRPDNISSSSDEELVEGGEKRKKNKGRTEKIDEKMPGDHVEKHGEVTSVPLVKHGKVAQAKPAIEPEEKKGMLDKIKNKLPGHNKAEEAHPLSSPTPAAECATVDGETKEKKGILEKIKEKIHHPKNEEEKKGNEKVGISH